MSRKSLLASSDLVLIFAQAATGLGHLRVTEALAEALPANIHGILLSSQTKSDTFLHRLTSTNPLLTRLLIYGQTGWLETALYKLLRLLLRTSTPVLVGQLETILEQTFRLPQTMVIVATHYGLAHQIGQIKSAFEKKNDVKILLVVVVTDDSPQKVWAVPGADLTVVPSQFTKESLEAYMRGKREFRGNTFAVSPYSVSPKLGRRMDDASYRERMKQYHSYHAANPEFSIPISGAAVQLTYLINCIKTLGNAWPGSTFHVVGHEFASTKEFFPRVDHLKGVTLHTSRSQRETIVLHEELFTDTPIGFEITKPSEQAYKALIPPSDCGGAILLFTDPIGRQEYDNIAFLRRHSLLPEASSQTLLWELADKHTAHDNPTVLEFVQKARFWRALMLPQDPVRAGRFIVWIRETGIAEAMGNFRGYNRSPELSKNGAVYFWQLLEHFLASHLTPMK